MMKVQNISSIVAHDLLMDIKKSVLIDVRTEKEWQEVGVPAIDKLILLTWRELPNMAINQEFEAKLTSQVHNKDTALFFLCRSGARSLEAANFANNIGYSNCYNIIDGFEGSPYGAGWKQNVVKAYTSKSV